MSSTQHDRTQRDVSVTQEINSPRVEPLSDSASNDDRGRSTVRSRRISFSIAGSYGAFSQQTPARSYIQQSVRGISGAREQYHDTNSFEVRDDTAELASRAIEDDSIYSSSPASRAWEGEGSGRLAWADTTSQESRVPAGQQRRETPRDSKGRVGLQNTEMPAHRDGSVRRLRTSSNAVGTIHELPFESSEQSYDDADYFDSTVSVNPTLVSPSDERTPLIKTKTTHSSSARDDSDQQDPESLKNGKLGFAERLSKSIRSAESRVRYTVALLAHPTTWDGALIWSAVVVRPMSYLPAVILGLLLNVLDALSYGMILFPLGTPLFSQLGPDGISMFYVSCIVSQLVYSCGGSSFRGGIGSEMIEVVPFFHSMAFAIMNHIGEDKPHEVLATTILAFSISSVLTGLAFFLLGSLKLGSLIGFFPRHILIGCIGGVGLFLVLTGLEVSARLEGNFEFTLHTLQKLVDPGTLPLWVTPLVLAAVLFIMKHWIKHSLTDAIFFVSIILIFYIIVLAIPQLSVPDLRQGGWVFEAPAAGNPWWHFYTLYDFGAVNWEALAETIPAMLALTFFGLLHVPINVPALALTTGEDNLDLDRELRAHGYSNALSGLCGSIQNYLVYTNTVLFIRAGADSRFAGFLLAAATAVIMVIGPVIIGYIPIMVVGALIFFLGFDLLRESLFDTWGKAGNLEYLTILIIVLTMGVYDFVIGIGVGIVLACASFVFQTSQISAVRGAMPGSVARSTVRRHPVQQRYLEEVGSQVYVMRLAGFLFFGTIVGVEKEIRKTLTDETFSDRPISFIVLDLSQVDGVDFSAAEAFTRINRILSRKGVRMILCGFSQESQIARSLANVGLFEDDNGIEAFTLLNSALEYCENEMLRTFYQRRDYMLSYGSERSRRSRHLDVPQRGRSMSLGLDDNGLAGSPRRGHLYRAATSTLLSQQDASTQRQWHRYKQPLQLILQTFGVLSPDVSEEVWQRFAGYLDRETWPAGAVLYRRGEPADGFYLLQSGILKAQYEMHQGTFSEIIVAGTTCGELPFFGEEQRTSTTLAERDSVTWVLRRARWNELQNKQQQHQQQNDNDNSDDIINNANTDADKADTDIHADSLDAVLVRELLKISLKLTGERMEAITKYMLVLEQT